MTPLFEAGFAHPCDGTGRYVELEGLVSAVSARLDDPPVSVLVETDRGAFTAYADGPFVRMLRTSRPGLMARIRIYDSGGGFYPDDVVCRLWYEDKVQD